MEGRFFKDNLSILGDVGVGTNNPRGPFEVYAASDATLVIERFTSNGIQLRADNSVDSAIRLGFEAYTYEFKNGSGTSRLYINSSGNVGIGTAVPDDKLDVVGQFRISANKSATTNKTNRIRGEHYDITEEPVTFMFMNSFSTTNTLYIGGGSSVENAATQLNFFTAANNTTTTGTLRMLIQSDGNVGIGTASPSQKLHVQGNLRVTGAYYDSNNEAGTSNQVLTSTGSATDWKSISDISDTVTGCGTTNYVTKWSNGANSDLTNSLIYDNGTNVGIGTASPESLLHLESSTSTDPDLRIVNTNNDNESGEIRFVKKPADGTLTVGDELGELMFLGSATDGTVRIGSRIRSLVEAQGSAYVNGNLTFSTKTSNTEYERVRITNGGNVGIGNTVSQVYTNENTSTVKLRVGSDTLSANQSSTIQIGGCDSSGGGTLGAIEFFNHRDDSIVAKIQVRRDLESSAKLSAGQIDFYTDDGDNNLNARMSIDALGNVGIGTTIPTQKLYVAGNAVVNGDIHLETAGDCITFYGNCNGNHSITSRDANGAVADDLRINTYGSLFINLDSNVNNTDCADFMIGRHGTSTISDWLFTLNGETGNVGIGTTSPDACLHLQGNAHLQVGSTTGGQSAVMGSTSTTDAGALNYRAYWSYDSYWDHDTCLWNAKRATLGRKWKAEMSYHDDHFQISRQGNVCTTWANSDWSNFFTIDSAGNVGIGTTSPGGKLDVNGMIKAGIAGNSSANTPALLVSSAGVNPEQSAIAIQQGTTEGDTIIFADYEPYVEWGLSTDNGLNTIEFTGGTNTNNLGSKTLYNQSGNARTAYKKAIVELTSGNMSVGGSVGIGTANPASVSQTPRLAVVHNGAGIATFDATGAGGGYITITDSNTPLAYLGSSYQLISSNGAITDTALRSQGELVFATGGSSERMRIDSSGKVGIGTTTPSYNLDVIGDISSNGQAIASYRRLRSYDTFATSTNNTAGWYPLFSWGTTTGDRGGYRVYISYTGGSWAPNTTVLKVFKNWSNDATITIEKYGATLYLPEVRIIGDATSTTVYTLEVYLNAVSQGHSFSVYYEALGYDEGGSSNVNWANSSLALSTNTGSVIASAKVSSEGIATQNLNISGDIYLADQLIHSDDSNTYFQFHNNDNMRLVANSVERFNIETAETVVNESGGDYNFRVEGDNDQNLLFVDAGTDSVGIGTVSPASKLHVYGADPVLTIQDSESTVANASAILRIGESDGTGGLNNNFAVKFVGTASGGDLDFSRYNNTTIANQGLRIKHDGNVGIGTTNPTRPLSVYKSTEGSIANFLHYTDALTYQGLYISVSNSTDLVSLYSTGNSGGGFNFFTGNTERMRLTSAGNVGIGTVSPTARLQVHDALSGSSPATICLKNTATGCATAYVGTLLRFSNSENTTYEPSSRIQFDGSTGATVTSDHGGGQYWAGIEGGRSAHNDGSTELRFYTTEAAVSANPVERLTINANGNVGIGTNDPVSTLEIVNNNESTTQTNFTQTLSSAGLIINTQYTANAYTPGLFWKTSSNSITKPKAGIYLKETGSGTYMYFGTSNNYSIGITNDALVINPNGNVGIGTTSPALQSGGTGLHINDTTNSELKFTNNTTGATASDGTALVASGSTFTLNNREAGSIKLGTSNTTRVTIDSAGNVGIGTANPLFKLHVNGDIYQDAGGSIFSNSNRGWYRQNYVTTGAGVSNGKIVTLNPPHGQTASNVFHYIFELTTAGTSTNTGATYIGVYNADTSAWVLRAVSLSGGSSNHPQLSVSGNNFTVYTNHSSNYTVVVSVTSVYNGDADSTAHSLGANYQWQRAVNDLYYNDGLVGIGTGTPSQKLHVQGNLRVTGAYYDSNNQAGSSGEILSSTGSGTDWVSLCQISGVTANGSQSTCYIPKWTDGTNEVIGNSVIYENASGNIGINCTTPSYKLHVNGSFAATCKSFVIDHPTKCGHMLRYGSLESPYHGVRLTGKSCTIGGEAKVSLPNYMCGLVHKEDINVQITNYRHGCTMWVDDVDISNNNFRVKTETEETKEFYWTFTAERKDVDRMQTEYKNV